MKEYKKHIFICEYARSKDEKKKSCGRSNSSKIKKKFKEHLKELKFSEVIRANSAGCLGNCKHGPVAVVYPEGVWYKGLKPKDVEEIVKSHLVNNKPVKRLMFKNEQ